MKIGAIVAINRDKDNIEYCLKGIYDFCDMIVVVYSDTTWVGQRREDETIDIIESFPDPQNKLKIIEGTFTTQTSHRTVGLEFLKKENYDYVFVVDSDEIYHPEKLVPVREFITKHTMEIYAFRVRWKHMWKSLQYVLVPSGKLFVFYKITPDFRFDGPSRQAHYRDRTQHENFSLMIPDLNCIHLTCVCSDEYMKEKLSTRNYRTLVVDGWYENIWKKWTPDMQKLHPTNPPVYKEAVLFDQKELPEFMKTHRYYTS